MFGNINYIDSIYRLFIVEVVKYFCFLFIWGGSKMYYNVWLSKLLMKIFEFFGRIKNLGLNSMLIWFFKKGFYFYNFNVNFNFEFVLFIVKFLEFNESFEVDDGEFESDEKGMLWIFEFELNDGEFMGMDCDEIIVVLDEEVEKLKECMFVESIMLI